MILHKILQFYKLNKFKSFRYEDLPSPRTDDTLNTLMEEC